MRLPEGRRHNTAPCGIWTKYYQFLQNYSGHRKPVVELYSDSDGQYLFSSSKDKSVRVWNLETETEIGEISLSHPGKLFRNIVS